MQYQTTRLPTPSIPSFDAPVDLRQVDDAVDYAARVCKATVGEFLAAPVLDPVTSDTSTPQIELAIEFLVPPASAEQFADELDRALIRRSLNFNLRAAGATRPARVVVLPPGAFHQWRSAWNVPPAAQHARRWSTDRRFLDGILIQAQIGWREIFSIA